jgi:hypothetical protein
MLNLVGCEQDPAVPPVTASCPRSAAEAIATEPDLTQTLRALPPVPNVLREPLGAVVWLVEAIAGIVCLVTLLTLAATIPVVNLLTLGYLLEVQGRVARTGRLRDALPLLPAARRIGLALAWIALWLVPLRWLAGTASDAWLISPGSATAWLWATGLAAAALAVAAHLLLAFARGGGFWCFLRPIKNLLWLRTQWKCGGYWVRASHALAESLAALQLPNRLLLAAFAYVGVYIWVTIPTAMFTAAANAAGTWQQLLTLAGGLCLVPPLIWLPLLETRCAAEGRFRAFFEVATIRDQFRHAPFRVTLATISLYVLAFLPLFYAAKLKVELPPHETIWDVMVIFVVTIYPAKVLLGWSYHRATHGRPAWRTWQWANRMVLVAAVGLYVLLLFLVQTSGQLGWRPVWQHHALLLPLPW